MRPALELVAHAQPSLTFFAVAAAVMAASASQIAEVLVFGERTAEDDEAGFDEPVHERRVFVPSGLLRQGRVPLQEVGVAAVPEAVFYDDPEAGRTLVRFAFCKRPEVIDEGVRRLAGLRAAP